MGMKIISVSGSARRAGVRAGDELVAVDGHPIGDVLDYRFYTYGRRLSLRLRSPGGAERLCRLLHEEGDDPGLVFESFLMSPGHTCHNRCVFCFIDQNPKGCRESLYYKDDDARLSFLSGNYITLTNLPEREIDRLCRMRVSPLGISVHTTDPELRVRMLRNPKAGQCLAVMRRFADAGIVMNAQIVLCPGWNGGDALRRTLDDLNTLGDALRSTSVVPVGLTRHREGLTPLCPVSEADARAVIRLCADYPSVYPSDEMFLRAGLPMPAPEFYAEYPQLENGVGMLALFREEWEALDPAGANQGATPQTLVTGLAAAPFFAGLLAGTNVRAVGVENRFFGDTVTVAGLLTGSDLLASPQLTQGHCGERILIPQNMLRHGTDIFLDNMTVPELEQALGIPIRAIPPNAASLREALEYN